VHRDIKPGNIMLVGGEAVVADFGIARAITSAGGEHLTESGIALGTPAYMSPEQAGGEESIDGRSDIYSLGCVLYEMLGGEPPFTGPNSRAIIARQMQEPPRSLQIVRPAVPPGIEAMVQTALQKVPADRFSTASQLIEALEQAESRVAATHARSGRWVWWLAALIGVATMFAIALAVRSELSSLEVAGGIDTTRYAILPFEYGANVDLALNERQLLQDALSRWSGIEVVPPFQLKDALARRDSSLSPGDARDVAREVGAGRYIRGEVSRIGDSVRLSAQLYGTARGEALKAKSVRVGSDLARIDSVFQVLADTLLFRSAPPLMRREGPLATQSAPARQAFAQGHEALERWDLVAADSAFSAATRFDPNYAQAFLWLAQVRSWNRQSPATWRSAAERAAAGRGRLSSRNQLRSDALAALARGEVVRACGSWEQLTRQDPYDFASWHGWSTCLLGDSVVVRDQRSPSGWRFRSSRNQALKAYQRALELLPSIHRSLRAGGYEAVRNQLMATGNQLQAGRSLRPDSARFLAYPSWQADSLAFTPWPEGEVQQGLPRTVPQGLAAAVWHQRSAFHEIATSWVTDFPQSPDAQEAVAIALGLSGDRAALGALRRARSLAREPEDRLRLAASEVWAEIKFSIPSDADGVRAARALADSLLEARNRQHPLEPRVLASLAALTGRARLAATLSSDERIVQEWGLPPALAQAPLPAFFVFAALGGPCDTLRTLERSVALSIERSASPPHAGLTLFALAYPATFAFPDCRLESISTLAGREDNLLNAQAAYLREDTAAVRRILSGIQNGRRNARQMPEVLTLDALYPEAALLAGMGDRQAAISWLDPTLGALARVAPQIFADALRAGPLVRALALRADLAASVGDTTGARRYANIVVVLWSDADPFLQETVERMRRLAGEG
ncbi:MAG TPA: serine/threonine-protein kinase, partial [Gemmatimonadales bacterium]|nr:serine/threonine-protein kinase [Gemmatimonadales bacterium]